MFSTSGEKETDEVSLNILRVPSLPYIYCNIIDYPEYYNIILLLLLFDDVVEKMIE